MKGVNEVRIQGTIRLDHALRQSEEWLGRARIDARQTEIRPGEFDGPFKDSGYRHVGYVSVAVRMRYPPSDLYPQVDVHHEHVEVDVQTDGDLVIDLALKEAPVDDRLEAVPGQLAAAVYGCQDVLLLPRVLLELHSLQRLARFVELYP